MSFYVYCIKNIINGKRYIGSRKCNGNPEDDLGIKYFSSSHNKEFMKEQKENPTLFEYEILKIFDNHKDMLEYEIYLHNFYDVGKNNIFYNLVKQTSTGFSTSGCKMSKKELKNKCKICGNPTNKKYCCSKKCFNIFIKDKNTDYNNKLSQKRIKYIEKNYNKICEINQKISEKVNQNEKGLKISETKRRNNNGNNNSRSYGRIIKIFDNNNILRYTIKNGESVKDFCLRMNMPQNIIKRSYRNNTKILCDEYKGWYCIKEII